ncbi:hypothetical protein Tco_0454963 [Tanacetum coccineum]
MTIRSAQKEDEYSRLKRFLVLSWCIICSVILLLDCIMGILTRKSISEDGICNVWVKRVKELLPNLVRTLALSIMKDAEEKGSNAPGKARPAAHAIAFDAFVCALYSLVGLLLNVVDAAATVTITATIPATDTAACS